METEIRIKNLRKEYKDYLVGNLRKEYNSLAVNDLNLEIYKGELFALLGVNGAGKTTVIKMLACLRKPTSGDAEIEGYSILHDSDKIKSIVDISTQEIAVAKNLSVWENLEFYGSLYDIEKEELNSRIDDLINKFNLEKYKNKRAGTLSGGLARKLSIAMSLISKPKVLFLD